MRPFTLLMTILLAIAVHNTGFSQSILKTINVVVVDAVSGRAIEGAEVTYKGILSKQSKKADAQGRVTFDIPLVGDKASATLMVNDGAVPGFSSHRSQNIPVVLVRDQNVYDITATLKTDYKRISITVIDEDTRQGIANASVVSPGARDGKNETATTDAAGKASMDVLLMVKTWNVPIDVSKDGYMPAHTSVDVTEATDQYAVTLSLQKDKSAKIIRVTVLSAKDNTPIPEATVVVEKSFTDGYVGTTDQNGVADVVVKAGGKFTVKVKAGNFEPDSRDIEVQMYGDEKVYPMAFSLKKKLFDRELRVMVMEEYEPGQMRPKGGAVVEVNNDFVGATGSDGRGTFKHHSEMGEMITVKASAQNYDSDTKQITVGGGDWRYVPQQYDEVQLTIKYNPADIKITVQVLDEKTNKPIPTATVSATCNDRNFSPASSSRGQYIFNVQKPGGNSYVRVKAKATGYEEK